MSLMQDRLLIDEVKKHREIFDLQARRDVGNKDKSWEEIAITLGFDVDVVKNRWRNIRDKYVREKRRRILHGEAKYSRNPWPLLKDMAFLGKYIYHRNRRRFKFNKEFKITTRAINPKQDLVCPNNADDGLSNLRVEENVKPEPPDLPIYNTEMDSVELNYKPESRLRELLEGAEKADTISVFEESASHENNGEFNEIAYQNVSGSYDQFNGGYVGDEEELFCLSIAASLKRFSPQKRALAKLRLQQVMYDLECEEQSLESNEK